MLIHLFRPFSSSSSSSSFSIPPLQTKCSKCFPEISIRQKSAIFIPSVSLRFFNKKIFFFQLSFEISSEKISTTFDSIKEKLPILTRKPKH